MGHPAPSTDAAISMKKTLFLLILSIISLHLYSQVVIDSIQIYPMRFDATTKWGFFESDVIKTDKYLTTLKGEKARECFKKIESLYQLLKKINTDTISGMDLRLVCIIYLDNETGNDTIGFSYGNYMTYNSKKISPRDNKMLKIISKYITNKSIRRSIIKSAKYHKQSRTSRMT